MPKIRILFVAPTLPVDNGSGGSIRSFQLYEELKTFADVDVLTANSVGISFPQLRQFRAKHRYLGHIVTSWQEHFFESQQDTSRVFKQILERTQYDYVFVRYYNTAYRIGALNLCNLVLDCDDCYIELSTQAPPQHSFRFFKPLLNSISAYYRRKNYLKNIEKIKTVIFSKKSEIVLWKNNFLLIKNKISQPYFSKILENSCISYEDKTTILFVGVLNYAPNFEGLDYFLKNIWPLVVENNTSITLKIVGGGLPDDLERGWLNIKQVNICGYVEDINCVYEDVDFSIAPVFKGSGTHIKVMESLVRKKTMVISRLAHRGYEDSLINADSLFVADSDMDFAIKIDRLSHDKKLRDKMSTNGHKKITEHHVHRACDSILKKYLLAERQGNAVSMVESCAGSFGEIYE